MKELEVSLNGNLIPIRTDVSPIENGKGFLKPKLMIESLKMKENDSVVIKLPTDNKALNVVYRTTKPLKDWGEITEKEIEIRDIILLGESFGINGQTILLENCVPDKNGYFTLLQFSESEIEGVSDQIDGDNILYKFQLNRVKAELYNQKIKPFKTQKRIAKKFVKQNEVIDKDWWEDNSWQVYLKHGKSKVNFTNQENTNNKRVLVLFHGTFNKKDGFYYLLNNEDTLTRLQSLYQDRIYLFNFPTVKKDIIENAKVVFDMFIQSGFPNSQVDIVATSRGALVARQLLLEFKDYPGGEQFIKRLVSVNGPNLGTPLAKNVSKFLSISEGIGLAPVRFWKNLRNEDVNKFGGFRGLSIQASNNGYIHALNEKYNQFFTANHHYLGTHNGKFLHNIFGGFKGKPNDGVIPVSSMVGKKHSGFDNYGYVGPNLNVENKLIVSKSEGGLSHGRQFKSRKLLTKILAILESDIHKNEENLPKPNHPSIS